MKFFELKKVAGVFDLDIVTEVHKEFLFNVRNSLARHWFFDDRSITYIQHSRWFEKYIKSDDLLFVIKDSTNRALIGTVGLNNKDAIEFARFCIIEQSYLKKGYASIILSSLFNAVFVNEEIEEITCRVLNTNPVLELYVSLGFRVCGYTEHYIPYEGRDINIVFLKLSKSDFYDKYRF